MPSANELRDLVIEVLLESSVAICAEVKRPFGSHELRSIPCRPDAIGRVLKIRKTSVGTLALCEVEVYGGKEAFIYMQTQIIG